MCVNVCNCKHINPKTPKPIQVYDGNKDYCGSMEEKIVQISLTISKTFSVIKKQIKKKMKIIIP